MQRLGGGTILVKKYFQKYFALMAIEMEKQLYAPMVNGHNFLSTCIPDIFSQKRITGIHIGCLISIKKIYIHIEIKLNNLPRKNKHIYICL